MKRSAVACWIVIAALLLLVAPAAQSGGAKDTEPRMSWEDASITDAMLIEQVLQLDQLIQAERETAQVPIDFVMASILMLDGQEGSRLAAMVEEHMERFGGRYSKDAGTLKFGPVNPDVNLTFYDERGKRIPAEYDEKTRDLILRLPDPPEADGTWKRFSIAKAPGVGDTHREENGVIWHSLRGGGTINSLAYSRTILPDSAILVDAYPRPLAIEVIDGRTSVTQKSYSGEHGSGAVKQVVFIWPEADGTSIEDLPPEYRGLRDPREIELAAQYSAEMEKILAGAEYRDQSTPLAALLTWNCAIVSGNKELFAECAYDPSPQAIRSYLEKPYANYAKHRLTESMDFLRTTEWPEKPQEGDVHVIHMSCPGTIIWNGMHGMIHHKGKWRHLRHLGVYDGGPDESAFDRFK